MANATRTLKLQQNNLRSDTARETAREGVTAKDYNPLQQKEIFLNPTKPKDNQSPELPPLNSIICGDALKVLQNIKQNDLFDVIIADPPYNIGKDFGNKIDDDNLHIDEYISWCEQWLRECLRLVKQGKPIYVYGLSEIIAHLAVRFPLDKQRWLAWHYTNKAVPSSKFWQRSHETIICFWKGKRPIINIDEIRIPYTESYKKLGGKKRLSVPCRYNNQNKDTVYNVHPRGALPRDVLHYPALAGGAGASERWFLCQTCDNQIFPPSELKHHREHSVIKHPTQKPLYLTQQLIRSAVAGEEVGTALVPFAGSGSECVAAKQLGVNYLGIELNKDYINLANGWLQQCDQ